MISVELNIDPSASSASLFADFQKLRPGDEVHLSKTIRAEAVAEFAALTGDLNPLHLDAEFARRTYLGRPVVHGMLLASYCSTLVGVHCPGPGALWTEQRFRWPAPVFVGDQIQFSLRVTHKSTGARALGISISATNQDGSVVMEGEGTVLLLSELRRPAELPLSERIAFVTGSNSELGAAIVWALAKTGAAVVLGYKSGSVAAEDLCGQITSTGGRALALPVDYAEAGSLAGAVRVAREKFGQPISVLINNTGDIPGPRAFMDLTWDDIQSMVDSHVRDAFHCCQAVIGGMIENKAGRIINIGSAFTQCASPTPWSNFLIAKAALQEMTRCLASELGPHGIRVNMVSPGLQDAGAVPGLSERLRKLQAIQTPLRRLVSASEVAAVVLSLCAKAGDFITGVEIPVCGGLQL